MAQAQQRANNSGGKWCVERLPMGYLYGETLRSRAASGLVLSERGYAPLLQNSETCARTCPALPGDSRGIYGDLWGEGADLRATTFNFSPGG